MDTKYPYPESVSSYATKSALLDGWLDGLPIGRYQTTVLYDAFLEYQAEHNERNISQRAFVSRCRKAGMERCKSNGIRYIEKWKECVANQYIDKYHDKW
jgi:hypothetical protein